ncbi:NAD(P)-dependent alcohol dehydrogenase [Microbacterium thalassium]|uniref:Aryl-alcohol dehydrogenase n=1 Tax=Microbacterium thalassium TaxID=362649 RepID=A0A7X0FN75_9MICO|nr:NAD(P)-dependent alcohol dehydrogenase [Microbacterium thalassium]MBB6390598.1 aryl-alcohol dehydrogenase [Microbacterium thalassium]GLK25708.1 aryl-alcohol dehydrogenase [Microbacterium thalassium]
MSVEITASVTPGRSAPSQVETVFIDEPGPGEALVRIVAAGVCHTDAITREGDLPLPLPGILGHEGAGVVEAVGPAVTQVAVGDRVVIGWPSCGECDACLDGEPRYCDHLVEALTSGARLRGEHRGESAYRTADGAALAGHFFGQSSFATASLVLADALVKVPDDVPLSVAAPLACGVTTGAGAVMNVAKPKPGDALVIWGTGAVGLAAIMAARNSPATTIIAVDLHEDRLALARELGATHTVNAAAGDALDEVRRICGGPADYAFECTGVIRVVEQAVESVSMRGTVILIGGAPADSRFSVDHFGALWGKRIVGVLGGEGRNGSLIPALLDLWRQGRFPIDRLIEDFAFPHVDEAIDAGTSGRVIKPVLHVSDDPIAAHRGGAQ